MWSAPATRPASVSRSQSTASPPPCEAPEVGQCPAGEGEDSSHPSRSQGSQRKCGLSCDSSQGGEGAEETCKVWEEQHGGEDCHHPRWPGGHRQTHRHCPGGPRQPHRRCPGGPRQPHRRRPGRHCQPHRRCPGGPRQPQSSYPGGPPPATAQLPRRTQPATAQLPRRTPPATAQLPRRAPPATAQLPRRAPPATAYLTNERPPAQLGNEGPPSQAPLNRASTAKSGTAEQAKDCQLKHR
ncbi:hypothetical protein NDU88_005017 [Pleurodeles waltl]|uniref:Uncharacterized protein n=1 Tax=Pleurodeles waltl TaxID=8319 RepID=A0AAV7TVX5_PLEWA|nr:hypothetical protein NDU88_005017 [Pleurodeles waltl]